MKIFISGASGLVGGNCLRYFREMQWQVQGSYFSFPTGDTVYFNTLDLQDTGNWDVLAWNPDVIVHCGALTHVDYCEDHEEESFQKTVQSTRHLLQLAAACKARLVYISTDYVFDGLHGPYSEEDEVHALSVYARHKLEAEQMVLAHHPDHLVLRVTNVYGDEIRNKNFVARIISQCREGKKLQLTLPRDQYATPVNARDIARAMFLLLRDAHSGVFHIASTDWMNRVELALRVLQYFPEASYELQPMLTADMKQAAARPLVGGLLHNKFASLYPSFLFSTVDAYCAEAAKK
ncbi:MAG TPA: SDR family oxidoreductase [Chitinophagaceae bacterium]|nr:SDR family oxidoreductase [Chitinophagaceae bacterium]HNF70777.1 SDR family oxidoreductase [Chitinophagaceae bacterium]